MRACARVRLRVIIYSIIKETILFPVKPCYTVSFPYSCKKGVSFRKRAFSCFLLFILFSCYPAVFRRSRADAENRRFSVPAVFRDGLQSGRNAVFPAWRSRSFFLPCLPFFLLFLLPAFPALLPKLIAVFRFRLCFLQCNN